MKPQENYYPSNGTEFMQFQLDNCDNCYKEKQCSILRGFIVLDIEPKQWIIKNNNAICTSFAPRRPKAKTTSKPNEPTLF